MQLRFTYDKVLKLYCNVCTGLSLDAIDSVLIELAELHATGYHWIQSYNGGAKQLVRDRPLLEFTVYLYDSIVGMHDIFNSALDSMGKILESEGTEELRMLGQKVKSQQRDWIKKVYADMRPQKDDFLTLLHGDAWYKNVLLR